MTVNARARTARPAALLTFPAAGQRCGEAERPDGRARHLGAQGQVVAAAEPAR